MVRKTIHALAAGALLASAVPALADQGHWDRDYRHDRYSDHRVVTERDGHGQRGCLFKVGT